MAKKIRRGQKVLRTKHEITMPYVHKKLTVCEACGNMGFVPIQKQVSDEVIELCKCVQCGKESMCEWWEKVNEQSEELRESTITDCEDGCKIK